MGIFPNFRGENTTYLKPPPRKIVLKENANLNQASIYLYEWISILNLYNDWCWEGYIFASTTLGPA